MSEDDQETIFGGDDDPNQENMSSASLSLDDVTGNVDYITGEDLEEGVEYEIQEIERDENPKFAFSGEDVNHAMIVKTTDDREQTVNAWGLWGMMRQAYREAESEGLESVSGLQLRIGKEGRGEYTVSWSLDGENWNEIEDQD